MSTLAGQVQAKLDALTDEELNDHEFAILQLLAAKPVESGKRAETDAVLLASLSPETRARLLLDGKSIPSPRPRAGLREPR